MDEIWKDIPGYEGYYQISNMGVARSLDRLSKRTGIIKKGIRLNPGLNTRGYMHLKTYIDTVSEYRTVHRIVAESFVPNPENKPQINHIDGNKLNNRANNLEWCTNRENCIHARDLGLRRPAIGVNSGGAKLDDTQVLTIRSLRRDRTVTRQALADYFKITLSTVKSIITRKTWKHL